MAPGENEFDIPAHLFLRISFLTISKVERGRGNEFLRLVALLLQC